MVLLFPLYFQIMSGKKRKAPTGMKKPTTKRPSNRTSDQTTPQIQTMPTPEQLAESVTNTVIEYLKTSGLVATPPNDTEANKEANGIQNTEDKGNKDTDKSNESGTNIDKPFTSSPPSCKQDKSKFVSSRVPLHATVSQKKKEKIWANEFIELSTLQEDEVEDICFNIHTGAVSSHQTTKKKFLTIEQWTDAFNIYASVRRVKYPDEAEGLSAYMGIVRRIAHEHGSWHYYDTNFRRLRQTTNYAWDEIENELFLVALSRKSSSFRQIRQPDKKQPPQGPQSTFRSCYKFNKGVPCGGCKFPHVCADCGRSNHGRLRCWSKRSNRSDDAVTSPSTNQTPNPGSSQNMSNTTNRSK